MKKYIFIVVIFFFLLNLSYFELEVSSHDTFSLIGLTIDGVESVMIPTKESEYAIDSILCDKGASGVWDYRNWTLKIRNITESRTKCQINFVSKYYEPILNGTDPVLKDGLIPVIIENDGVVKKASLGWKWYEYGDTDSPRWANAVILNDESEIYYDGDIIPEDAIESYFVWIPRYKYQIFNVGNYPSLSSSVSNIAKEIKIEFENKDTLKSNGSTIGSWLTHLAFTSFETNGMWVGKFETGYKDASNKTEAQKNENNPGKVQIKPNVYSWREIQVANAYYTSLNYKKEYNSHMMKNTEWGAVAYLQHSKYGSHVSVRINNNANNITGYSAKKEPTCGQTGTNEECNKYESTNRGEDGTYTVNYFNSGSVAASTTNNYSGIYDMSGGVWEYVMGVMLNSTNSGQCSGKDATYNSGFNGFYCYTTGSKTDGVEFPTDGRYYDIYNYATLTTKYERRILGDATGEMGPFANKKYGTQTRQIGSWHNDEAWFIVSYAPWFHRGGGYDDGTDAGVFAFDNTIGFSGVSFGYRIVLSI